MKIYQCRKSKYKMPQQNYMETIYAIRGYPELVRELEDAITATPEHDGQPKGSDISNYPERYIIKYEYKINKRIAIEEALNLVPEEYRSGIFLNIVEGKSFPLDADRSTYSRWKSLYVHAVAKRLGICP